MSESIPTALIGIVGTSYARCSAGSLVHFLDGKDSSYIHRFGMKALSLTMSV